MKRVILCIAVIFVFASGAIDSKPIRQSDHSANVTRTADSLINSLKNLERSAEQFNQALSQ